jgi:hypothetical protein
MISLQLRAQVFAPSLVFPVQARVPRLTGDLMKRFAVVAALLALAAPAAFAAPPAGKGKPDASASSSSGQSSAALCKEQRRSMGMSAFRALYAPNGSPKAAMDACLTKVSTQVASDEKNAAKACKAERAKDPVAFADTYGTNANKRNAFGKCVSQHAKKDTEQEQEDTVSAAKACKKEKADNAQAFADKYGTNANKRNAFGKCVSATSKESDDSNDSDD